MVWNAVANCSVGWSGRGFYLGEMRISVGGRLGGFVGWGGWLRGCWCGREMGVADFKDFAHSWSSTVLVMVSGKVEAI